VATSRRRLFGTRNIKAVTGIRVRYVHFNASGEGKRWETDGHNTDIKVRREMRRELDNHLHVKNTCI
jgi:hypothetical protein